MKLSRVTKIREHRVFRDFAWPASLHSFGQFNLIYGWNGSGKTTLSSLLTLLEKGTPLGEGEVELEFDNGTEVSGADFGSKVVPQVRVFNRDFVNETLKSVGDIAPIYFIGEGSAAKQARLEVLRKELGEAATKVSSLRESKVDAERRLDEFAKERAKLIKEALTSSSTPRYNKYNKGHFSTAIETLTADRAKADHLSDADVQDLRRQKDEQVKPSIELLATDSFDVAAMVKRVDKLVGRSVVASTIHELVEDPDLAEWVAQGLELHSGKHSATCRFCTQSLSKARRAELAAHFNDSFTAYRQELTDLLADLSSLKDSAQALRAPDIGLFYAALVGDAKSAAATLAEARADALALLQRLIKRVEKRRVNPFDKVGLAAPDSKSGNQLDAAVKGVDAIIARHNRLSAKFEDAVAEKNRKLEAHYVAEAFDKNAELRARVASTEAELEKVVDKPSSIQAEIDGIEAAIRGHQRPAEELTKELSEYLGREELRFEVADAGYRLARDGQPVTHLSEGERTAIAFLYFLKSLQDQSFDMKTGIVVIDDPVSSLDANALFSAFGYMKERTKNCGQLFIFTHNFQFFRNVKNWFHHLPGQKKKPDARPARFFLLSSCRDANGARTSQLGPLDPLLEEHESEYQYLFRCIYTEAHRTDVATLEHHYGLPNIARRLLEAFLAFRFPDLTGDLRARLDRVKFDGPKKTAILRLLHTYSHADAIAEPEHDLSLLAETRPVLRGVLEMMKAVDREHYEGLERLVAPAAPTA